MTWTPITLEQIEFGLQVSAWIEIARGQYGPEWLPSHADFCKSALLERLRSGKDALSEPPPLGYSCPWYALIEDPGPHYLHEVEMSLHEKFPTIYAKTDIFIMQNSYSIESMGEKFWIVKDGRHDTSYRFRLWFDSNWKHPNGRINGGWFIRNIALEKDNG
jgi:hypothetical protein